MAVEGKGSESVRSDEGPESRVRMSCVYPTLASFPHFFRCCVHSRCRHLHRILDHSGPVSLLARQRESQSNGESLSREAQRLVLAFRPTGCHLSVRLEAVPLKVLPYCGRTRTKACQASRAEKPRSRCADIWRSARFCHHAAAEAREQPVPRVGCRLGCDPVAVRPVHPAWTALSVSSCHAVRRVHIAVARPI